MGDSLTAQRLLVLLREGTPTTVEEIPDPLKIN
jgi:hypothetical protein